MACWADGDDVSLGMDGPLTPAAGIHLFPPQGSQQDSFSSSDLQYNSLFTKNSYLLNRSRVLFIVFCTFVIEYLQIRAESSP